MLSESKKAYLVLTNHIEGRSSNMFNMYKCSCGYIIPPGGLVRTDEGRSEWTCPECGKVNPFQVDIFMSRRVDEWNKYSEIVSGHIKNYTIPQYGDMPDDMISTWSVDDCIKAIKRYCDRSSVSRRGELESLRDLVKIGHYACIALNKKAALYKKEGLNTEVMLNAIKEGTC
jgi:predicted RNA-binding Zn-ribbon protein involved in translation (DUF1610 family)